MIPKQKIIDAVNREYLELCEDCFAHWVTCLFIDYEGFTYQENKEAFLYLIEKLLREGRVKFIAPDADCYISPSNPNPKYTIQDEDAHWKVSPDEIISYLKSKWPKDISDGNDVELTYFFYEIPGIFWLGKDGKWYGS